MISSVVDELTGKSSKPWRGILTPSVVLLLAVSVLKGATDPPASPPALNQNPQVQNCRSENRRKPGEPGYPARWP
jgi:hypothetical protein